MSTTDHFELPVPTPGLEPMETVSEAIAKVRAALIAVDGILYAHATGIAGKAASDHVHEIAGITGLVDALAAKMAADATFTLAGLTDISGAVEAPGGYVLTKGGGSGFQFMSAAAALGTHGHLMSEVTGLTAALADVDTALDGKLALDGSNIAGNAPALRSSIKVASEIEVKSGNYTAGAADRGKLLVFSSAAILSFAAAATLGGDWPIYVRNESSGDVVLDPDGAEEVDGKTTVMVPPGYTATIWCDGTAFRTDLPKTIQRVYDLAGLSTLEFYVEDGILEEQIDLVGVVTSANGSIQSRVSLDGSTYPAGGSDYRRSYIGNGAGMAFAGYANFNASMLWELVVTSGIGTMASLIYDPGDAGRQAMCSLSGSSYHGGNGRSSYTMAGETASNGRWWGVRIYTTSGTFTDGKVVRRSIRS